MPDDYKEQAQFDKVSPLHEFYNPILYKLVLEFWGRMALGISKEI